MPGFVWQSRLSYSASATGARVSSNLARRLACPGAARGHISKPRPYLAPDRLNGRRRIGCPETRAVNLHSRSHHVQGLQNGADHHAARCARGRRHHAASSWSAPRRERWHGDNARTLTWRACSN